MESAWQLHLMDTLYFSRIILHGCKYYRTHLPPPAVISQSVHLQVIRGDFNPLNILGINGWIHVGFIPYLTWDIWSVSFAPRWSNTLPTSPVVLSAWLLSQRTYSAASEPHSDWFLLLTGIQTAAPRYLTFLTLKSATFLKIHLEMEWVDLWQLL